MSIIKMIKYIAHLLLFFAVYAVEVDKIEFFKMKLEEMRAMIDS